MSYSSGHDSDYLGKTLSPEQTAELTKMLVGKQEPLALPESSPELPPVEGLDRINAAVNECLADCFAAGHTAASVTAYLSGLRAKGWRDGEVALVRATVTRRLQKLAGELDGGWSA